MSHTDQILVAGIISKDKNAFQELYRLYYTALCKHAYTFVLCVDASEDIVQEAIIKLWKLKSGLREDTNLQSYLYQSVRNSAIDYIKTKVKDRELRFNLLQNARLTEPEDEEENVEKEETNKRVAQLIKTIPERSRTVLELSRYRGLKHREIAEKLNITVKGVEYHITKAMRHLEKELVKYVKT